MGIAVVRPRVQSRTVPAWLRDSKMLSEGRREEIFAAVGKWCEAWSVGHATPTECDEWGMTEALRVAAQRALAGLGQGARRPPDRRAGEPVAPTGRPRAFSGRRPARGRRRRPLCLGGGSLGLGQGHPRSHHARRSRSFPRVRVRAEQGLPVADPPDRTARLRAVGHSPAQLGLHGRAAVARTSVSGPYADFVRRRRPGTALRSVLNVVEARIGLAFNFVHGGVTSPNPNRRPRPWPDRDDPVEPGPRGRRAPHRVPSEARQRRRGRRRLVQRRRGRVRRHRGRVRLRQDHRSACRS